MQRWISIIVGAAIVALAVWITMKTMNAHPVLATGHALLDASSDAATRDADVAIETSGDGGLALGLGDIALPTTNDAPRDAGAWARMPDGAEVPPLPANAPRQVHVGVVLVSYAGADIGAVGQKTNARSKKDALELATRLAVDAKTDFHGAVQRGDNGSADDIGHIPRGVLEPAPEYILFTLPTGAVSDAFETPRGYWIAKRLD
jgi:hypothetical protein